MRLDCEVGEESKCKLESEASKFEIARSRVDVLLASNDVNLS